MRSANSRAESLKGYLQAPAPAPDSDAVDALLRRVRVQLSRELSEPGEDQLSE